MKIPKERFMYSHLVNMIFLTQMRNIKKTFSCMIFFLLSILLMPGLVFSETVQRQTHVEIVDHMFYINGIPTYQGRVWMAPTGEHYKIEGLLMNSRMVQGIFDDLNPKTVERLAYPDTNQWDADRNTREFIAAMPEWHKHGMLAFTLNLQGGSPEGYSGVKE
jgi:hypothetical protein